jgi:hypothetical protein
MPTEAADAEPLERAERLTYLVDLSHEASSNCVTGLR